MNMKTAWKLMATIGLALFLAAGAFRAASLQANQETAKSDTDPTAVHEDGKMNTPANQKRISKSGYDITPLADEHVKALASKLPADTCQITQDAGTERPFSGALLHNKNTGLYTCVVCGLPLFSSEHKFDSGSGWPSFYEEFDPEHVTKREDTSHGMTRTEITCTRCGAHLGHMFDDGPRPTGLRYCLNSASLDFDEGGKGSTAMQQPTGTEVAYFAGGCFWGLEHYFQAGPGVIDAISGYMQGKSENPTYKQVCGDDSGHAETVKVVFDPSKITFRRLLQAFFDMHDATQLNRQGPDVGTQYRSGIWFVNEEQRQQAEALVKELQASDRYKGRKIVTQIEKARTFWPAEEYHQDYIAKTGGVCHVANPWD